MYACTYMHACIHTYITDTYMCVIYVFLPPLTQIYAPLWLPTYMYTYMHIYVQYIHTIHIIILYQLSKTSTGFLVMQCYCSSTKTCCYLEKRIQVYYIQIIQINVKDTIHKHSKYVTTPNVSYAYKGQRYNAIEILFKDFVSICNCWQSPCSLNLSK